MANRNFDSRVIIQRLQNKNYARNLYQQNVDGQRLINNPQNSDGNSSRYVTFVPGAQTDYYRTLAGTTTINQGGTFGISSIPPSTAPPPPSIAGSMYFDSAIVPNGSHVSYPNNSSLAIGTRSFTIEWYQYFIRGEPFPRLFSIGSYSQESISIAVSYEEGEGNSFIFWKNNSANFIGIAPPYETWTHIAIVGTTDVGIKIYQNGVEIGNVVGAYDFTDTTTPLMIGNESVPTQQANFKGNITNFRWVVGQALYTTTFTPPTIPLANIIGTQLLLAVSSEQGVVRDSSSANRTPSNTGVIYSPQLPIMPFVTAPSAPTIISITPGNAMLTVNFTPPVSNGGSAITDYEYSTDFGNTFLTSRITSSPMIINVSSNGSPLVNDTTYYIQIRAVNSVGAGLWSNTVSATPASNAVIIFPTVGTTTWTAPDGITSIDYLIVGGGGGSGGGYDTGAGGGGGGGMVRSGTTSVTPGTTYTVVIGDGGAGGISNRTALPETDGNNGENSSFDTIVALGGGKGYASRQPPLGNNGAGGSAASNPSTASEGGRGGGSNGGGGGGGGSVGNGTNKIGTQRGFGGSGTSSSMSGSSITYGVGGDGGTGANNNAGTPGAVNTGNGARGGGATAGADNDGAKGGSGIIIISYTPVPTTVPEPPTALSGVGVNQQILVSFTAGNNGGSAITNYQYSTDDGTTYRALSPADTTSSITITTLSSDGTTNLTNGVAYTVRLKAVNANGASIASSSISVTPVLITVPPEPTALSAVGGDQAIYVLFTQSGDGGSAITNYQYSVDGGSFVTFSPAQTFSPVEITTLDGTTRLTNGTSYSVTLKAVNIVGSSIESASTSTITTINTLNTTSLLVELDANNSSSYSGTGTAWTNLQSAGLYSATLLNGPSFDNTNNYFTFDGINQIAQIPAATAINATVGSSFTIQIWARVNTSSPEFSSFDGVISKQFGPGSYDGYSLSLIADTSVQLTMNGQSVNGRYSSSTGVYSNGWALYTIVVRFGGGSGNPSYAYVSTRRVVTAANSESFMPSQAPMQFPRGIQEGSFNYCPADVGAFYLYNTAVSQEDIIRNYDATKTRYGL